MDKISIGNRIKERRKELKMTAETVAEKLNKHKATVYRYESDEIQNMPYDVLIPISKVLKTNPMYLMGLTENKEMTLDDLNNLKIISDKQEPLETPKIKVYGKIAAGEPIEMVEDVDEINCPWATNIDDLFALQVKGDSMNKIVLDGHYAVLKKCEEAITGKIYAVMVDNENATLKRLHILDNAVMLEPLSTNPIHERKVYEEESNIRVIGKYIGCVSPYQN